MELHEAESLAHLDDSNHSETPVHDTIIILANSLNHDLAYSCMHFVRADALPPWYKPCLAIPIGSTAQNVGL